MVAFSLSEDISLSTGGAKINTNRSQKIQIVAVFQTACYILNVNVVCTKPPAFVYSITALLGLFYGMLLWFSVRESKTTAEGFLKKYLFLHFCLYFNLTKKTMGTSLHLVTKMQRDGQIEYLIVISFEATGRTQ